MTGKILGGKLSNYLLEKSRISFQTEGERNYHIFYHLLKGYDEANLEELGLLFTKDKNELIQHFNYLKKTNCFVVENIDDSDLFQNVVYSFQKMKFSKVEQCTIFRIVASVLLLGLFLKKFML